MFSHVQCLPLCENAATEPVLASALRASKNVDEAVALYFTRLSAKLRRSRQRSSWVFSSGGASDD